MLTAYHVSLPHACCPLLWWRVASGHSAIIMRLCGLRYTSVHGVMNSFHMLPPHWVRKCGNTRYDQVWDTTVPLESVTFRHRRAEVTFFTTSHASPIQHNSITAYEVMVRDLRCKQGSKNSLFRFGLWDVMVEITCSTKRWRRPTDGQAGASWGSLCERARRPLRYVSLLLCHVPKPVR